MMARFQLSDAEQELVRGLGVHCVADMAFLSQELTDMSALGLHPVSALKLGKLLSHLAPASGPPCMTSCSLTRSCVCVCERAYAHMQSGPEWVWRIICYILNHS